ncbi:hypothetical protein ACH5RR_006142 [Cinchona calisaya]|uniref:Protein kinase domain-containing protein n=1 Tax=Cinchona calisaya TaxID=153742 RepID=A0ABD3AN58_9GENT
MGLNGSVIAVVVLSASVVVILCCAVALVLVLKHREQLCQPKSTAPATITSLAKSSGHPATMIGSGQTSVSLSYGSSVAAYACSAKSFSSSDIEKATDNFSETRIIGEGGFGHVYNGVLEDGIQVAVKILTIRAVVNSWQKWRCLVAFYNRNLVKLIGICTDDVQGSYCLSLDSMVKGNLLSNYGIRVGYGDKPFAAKYTN